jgi:hypothetical protein
MHACRLLQYARNMPEHKAECKSRRAPVSAKNPKRFLAMQVMANVPHVSRRGTQRYAKEKEGEICWPSSVTRTFIAEVSRAIHRMRPIALAKEFRCTQNDTVSELLQILFPLYIFHGARYFVTNRFFHFFNRLLRRSIWQLFLPAVRLKNLLSWIPLDTVAKWLQARPVGTHRS